MFFPHSRSRRSKNSTHQKKPGHHAEVDVPRGFCLFGNVALAAAMAKEQGDLGRVFFEGLVGFVTGVAGGFGGVFFGHAAWFWRNKETPKFLFKKK